jgi:hypothetical protein
MSREVNPRIGLINVKVGLYRVGMVGMIVANAALVLKSVDRIMDIHPLCCLLPDCRIGWKFPSTVWVLSPLSMPLTV